MNMIATIDEYEEEEETPMLQLSPFNHADLTVEHELLPEVPAINDHKNIIRTGTLWSTIAHIITAVIGSGVLSLAWSLSQLGWIGGPLALFCFALVTYVSSSLLSDCYRSPDPVTGSRNPSYTDAVRVILGIVMWFASVFELLRDWCCLCCYHLNLYEGDSEIGLLP